MLRKRKLIIVAILCILVCLSLPSLSVKKSSAGNMPILVIESYELAEGDFSPGSQTTIALKIKNKGIKYSADSVVVTMSSTDMIISPVYGTSNQVMVDSIAAGQEAVVQFTVDVPSEMEVEKATISFNISYAVFASTKGDDIKYETFANDTSISIPVTYDQSFSVTNVSVADTTNVGATTLVSLSYSNNDVRDVTEIELIIEGNIEEDTSKVSIGELPAGQTGVKDTYVKFTQAGKQTLKMSISYKDADGRVIKKDLGESTVDVDKTVSSNSQSSVEIEQDNSSSILKMALIAIGVLLVAACIVMYTYKKKRD